jgi:hypothetical protein
MRRLLAIIAMLAGGTTSVAAQHGIAVHARGFADFNYIDREGPGTRGFRTGQIVGHLTSGLTDRITLFSEASATPSSNGFSFEVERLILRYDRSDRLKLGVGRFHAPITYWNIAFHHGQWLQPSLSRPDMTRPPSGFIPMHFLGVWAEGVLTHSPVALDYTVGVGNGRHASLTRAGDAGDVNDSRAFVASTSITLPAPLGLRVGGALYADRLTPRETVDASERIVSAHVATTREAPEIVIEYARITHDPRNGIGTATTSHAGYALIAFRLPGKAQALEPYVRLDRTSVPAADSVFAPLGLDYSGRIAGVRYDVAPTAAFKLEYRSERFESGPRLGTFAAQFSFTFPGIGSDPVLTDHESAALVVAAARAYR